MPDDVDDHEPISAAGARGAQIHGLDEEALTEIRAAFPAAVETAGPRLGETLRRIEALMAQISPIEIMGVLAIYCLTAKAGTNPEYDRPMGIFQSDVEVAQALALRQPLRADGEAAPFYPGGKDIFDLLPQIRQCLDLLDIDAARRTAQKKGLDRAGLTLSLRLHERHVRGWAYSDQLERLLKELFRPLDGRVRERIGWSPVAVVDWWKALGEELNRRIERHRALVRDALAWPVDQHWPSRVRDQIGVLPAPPDEDLVALARQDEQSRLGFIMHSSDRRASSVYRFTLNELATLYPEEIDPSSLHGLLDRWSLRLGELGSRSANDLVRDNPVLSRPLLRDDDAWYLFLAPTVFGHSSLTLIEDAISNDHEVWSAYLNRRAEFLEKKASSILAGALPGAEVCRNIHRTDPTDGKSYESDVLVLLDSYAVIAECKAGRLPRSARRGKGRALREQVDELIVEPATQAHRLADALIAADGPLELIDAAGQPVIVDAGRLRRAITLGVTLDPFAGLLPRLGELVQAGLTDRAVEDLALSVAVTDLEVIAEILSGPSEVLHYLTRRTEIERGTFLAGEELDVLGFYLETGLNIGEAEFDPAGRLHLTGSSDPIDRYHYRRIEGLPAERPAARRTEWWAGVLRRAEQRGSHRWTEVGVAMCNVSFDDQEGFERSLLELREGINDGSRPAADFVHLANGPPQRRDHFAGVIATSPDRNKRLRGYEDAARVVLGATDAQRVIVIGLAPIPLPPPYVFLGVYDRSTGSAA